MVARSEFELLAIQWPGRGPNAFGGRIKSIGGSVYPHDPGESGLTPALGFYPDSLKQALENWPDICGIFWPLPPSPASSNAIQTLFLVATK